MIYSIHNTDLTSDAPRVVPAPMTTGALYLGAGIPLEDEVAEFLTNHGDDPADERGRWYIEVWDRSGQDVVAAKASFIWSDGDVLCEAISVDPDYSALDLKTYLQRLGSGLWGVPGGA